MTSSYPLNCLTNTGDGFSGWFAITNARKCNDFCYWSNADGDDDYSQFNTANPHHTTMMRYGNNTSYWECVYDAADDAVLVSVVGERWVDSFHRFMGDSQSYSVDDGGVPFPYLKCQKGSGEELSTWDGRLVQSAVFWESWIFMCAAAWLGQLILVGWFCRKKLRKYETIGIDDSTHTNGEVDEDDYQLHSLQMSESVNDMPPTLQDVQDGALLSLQLPANLSNLHDNKHTTPRCKMFTPINKLCNTRQKWTAALKIILILSFNTLLALTIAFSSISLMEIHNNPAFKTSMRQWTPACSDPSLVCDVANRDIHHISLPWNASEFTSTSSDAGAKMKPFSYLIASDAQLNWFNGEFPEIGKQELPTACSVRDSCGSCTRKFGRRSNLRLRGAWESLMAETEMGGLVVPDTLIMNGDLTAYFHPSEKHAYDSIYQDIQGLKSYFPSLGNHDIEHMGGAKYGGDQWNGPPNCNIEHAIGYFKSGFCGQIPKFHADRIVRYDSSSLAYSWEEGRYHFVHTHYYPTYEMASMKFRSSMDWLERDLRLARDAGFATVLFVHAANYLNPAMERVVLGKNVIAIIAGHDHRCLGRRCEGLYPIWEDQLESGLNVEKCIPASYDTCQVLNGENLIYVKDIDIEKVPMPKKKLKNREQTDDQPLCPKPAPFYINETDNSLLCRRVRYNHPNFPSQNDANNTSESIPMFWSGSASFETFLRVDFFDDRITVNAMALMEDGNVSRYIDVNSVPNARYPYHEDSDLEEVVIPVG